MTPSACTHGVLCHAIASNHARGQARRGAARRACSASMSSRKLQTHAPEQNCDERRGRSRAHFARADHISQEQTTFRMRQLRWRYTGGTGATAGQLLLRKGWMRGAAAV